jgi:hypothetical protein
VASSAAALQRDHRPSALFAARKVEATGKGEAGNMAIAEICEPVLEDGVPAPVEERDGA